MTAGDLWFINHLNAIRSNPDHSISNLNSNSIDQVFKSNTSLFLFSSAAHHSLRTNQSIDFSLCSLSTSLATSSSGAQFAGHIVRWPNYKLFISARLLYLRFVLVWECLDGETHLYAQTLIFAAKTPPDVFIRISNLCVVCPPSVVPTFFFQYNLDQVCTWLHTQRV